MAAIRCTNPTSFEDRIHRHYFPWCNSFLPGNGIHGLLALSAKFGVADFFHVCSNYAKFKDKFQCLIYIQQHFRLRTWPTTVLRRPNHIKRCPHAVWSHFTVDRAPNSSGSVVIRRTKYSHNDRLYVTHTSKHWIEFLPIGSKLIFRIENTISMRFT